MNTKRTARMMHALWTEAVEGIESVEEAQELVEWMLDRFALTMECVIDGPEDVDMEDCLELCREWFSGGHKKIEARFVRGLLKPHLLAEQSA